MGSTPSNRRICVQWPRFGPIHLARLGATHTYFAEKGVEVIGLETASNDAIYEWRVERGEVPFPRVQVFPNRVFDTISPAEMHTETLAALDRLNPDAVAIMSYGFPDARAALLWCRRNRRTAIIMMASKEDDAPRVGWRERVKGLIVRQFDAAIVGGTPQHDYIHKLGLPEEVIFTKYNAVDNSFFSEGAEAARKTPGQFDHLPGLDDPRPFFFASNRFIPRKNLDRLLIGYEAYRAQSKAQGLSPWRLLMLGDGPLRPDLERLVHELQIEDVVFCGFQQIEDLPAYYGLAGAFVHPALVDQWALVVNEAMAAQLPVVVSTGAGCSNDLVHEGKNGFTFAPEDIQTLTSHLLTIAAPSTDRNAMGRCSRRIVAGWSLECFAQSLWKAFQAGLPRSDRRANPVAQSLLTLMNLAPNDVKAYHSVEV